MKLLLLLCMPLMGLFCFSKPASAAQFDPRPYVQVDILRVAPDDSAAFVPIAMPIDCGTEPAQVKILSRQGEWEEVSLHYHFKYNGSTNPNICAISLFNMTFTGFRKITENK